MNFFRGKQDPLDTQVNQKADVPDEQLRLSAWTVVPLVILAFVVIASVFPSRFPKWTGFPESTDRQSLKITETDTEKTATSLKVIEKITISDKLNPAKSLWDWIGLLLAPATLAGLGFLFQFSQEKAKVAKENADRVRDTAQKEADKERDADHQREQALQNYLTQLSELLVDKKLKQLLQKKENTSSEISDNEIDRSAALVVVKVRTLALMRMFEHDMTRKASILSFLGDADLLEQLDLDLSRSSWRGSKLRGSNLCKVNLFGADFSNADLSYADLSYADLSYADLSEANLKGAVLIGAELRKANLKGLKNWTLEQLSKAKLCQTKMPERCNLKPDRDCPEEDIETISRRTTMPRQPEKG